MIPGLVEDCSSKTNDTQRNTSYLKKNDVPWLRTFALLSRKIIEASRALAHKEHERVWETPHLLDCDARFTATNHDIACLTKQESSGTFVYQGQ